MHSRYSLILMLFTTLFIIGSSFSLVEASNRYQVHENAITFEEAWNYLNPDNLFSTYCNQENYFPVGWSGSWSTYKLFDLYERYYYPDFDVLGELTDVLVEAENSGINFVFMRSFIESSYTWNDYIDVANTSRENGLNVIAGGFKTTNISDDYNNGVFENISQYMLNYPPEYFPGCVIGTGGMDCPDAQEEYTGNSGYFDWTKNYSQMCEHNSGFGYDLPFSCLLEEQGYTIGNNWHWSTGLEPPPSGHGYIYRYCSIMSLPSYDWYPCRVNYYLGVFLLSADRWTAADIFPENNSYYKAYADRDELIAINETNAGGVEVAVFQANNNDEHPYHFDFQLVGSLNVPGLVWSEDLEIATSGPLSSDIGDREMQVINRNLNGGVAFWEPDCDPCEVRILYHNGIGIDTGSLSCQSIGYRTLLVALGQDDYLANHDPYEPAEGITCQEEMRVLCCYMNEKTGTIYAGIYEKPDQDDTFSQVDRLEIDFKPAHAVWGYFWPRSFWPYFYSGFVICDKDGDDWAFIYRSGSSGEETWTIKNCRNPFGNTNGYDLVDLDVYRRSFSSSRPNFAPQNDYLMGTLRNTRCKNEFEIRLEQGQENYGQGYTGFDGDPDNTVTVSTGSITFKDISDVVIDSHGRKDVIFCNLYTTVSPEPDGVAFTEEFSLLNSTNIAIETMCNWCYSEDCAFRIRATRKPITNALLINDDGEARFYRARRAYEIDETQYSRLSQSIHYEHIWGVVKPDLILNQKTCLMTTVQAYGRATFGGGNRYCPSLDEIMYLSISPVIHGTRALHYYNLSAALEASFGDVNNRLPWEMTSWNSSIDPEDPGMDLVSTVHSAVAILTGSSYAPPGGFAPYESNVDFLSSVVSDDWEAIPDDESMVELERVNNRSFDQYAYLVSNYSGDPPAPVESDSLNFLALINSAEDEILLLVSNDSTYSARDYSVYFPNIHRYLWTVEIVYAPEDWIPLYNNNPESPDAVQSEGISCSSINGTDDIPGLYVNLFTLPEFSAALFRITNTRNDSFTDGLHTLGRNSLQILNNAGVSVNVQVLVADDQEFTLSVYDMAGRIVSQESGTGSTIVSYNSNVHPVGAYFVMLKSGEDSMVKRMVLLH